MPRLSRQELRDNAAALAKDCRRIERKGNWTIREWNSKVRFTVRNYMQNIRRFENANY